MSEESSVSFMEKINPIVTNTMFIGAATMLTTYLLSPSDTAIRNALAVGVVHGGLHWYQQKQNVQPSDW